MNKLLFSFLVLFSMGLKSQTLKVSTPIRYLALGDSYTIGQSVTYNERWPRQLFDSLKNRGFAVDTIHFIARTGWRTDNLQTAINQQKPDSNYNLVSLLIGVNNEYQRVSFDKYIVEFPILLSRAIALAGGDSAQVFVVSIPDYAYTPFGDGRTSISENLKQYDDFAEAHCDSLGIKFYYIGDISKRGLDEPDLVANDGLHPSGKQYTLYVNRILGNDHLLSIATNSVASIDFPTVWKSGDTINLGVDIDEWELYTLNGKQVGNGFDNQVTVNFISGLYVLKYKKNKEKRQTIRIKID